MESSWRISYAGQATYGQGYAYDNWRRFPQPRGVIQYTLEGRLDWHDGHGHRRIGPGQFVLFTSHERSRYGLDRDNLEPYRCRWLSLAGAGIDVFWRALIERHGALHGPDQGYVLAAMRELTAESDTRRIHAFVGELCHWLDRRRFEIGSPVERALRAIEAEPYADRGVAETAARHGVSREHLSMVFHRRHGLPPGAWLLQQRLARARELLEHTPLRLAEVAERCGMGNARRLSRALRREDRLPSQ